MSVFSSKFDLVTEESFAAPGAVAVMLEVGRTSSFDSNGTPIKGTITAGSIVKMDSAGKAVVANHPGVTDAPILPLVVIDGTDTFSGSFTSRVTCLAGGFQMKTDQFDKTASGADWAVGRPVSFDAGLVAPWASGKQILGYVGKDGLANGQLHVIVVSKV